jgi:hypothetical protein
VVGKMVPGLPLEPFISCHNEYIWPGICCSSPSHMYPCSRPSSALRDRAADIDLRISHVRCVPSLCSIVSTRRT